MKKLILLLLLVSSAAYSKNLMYSWECGDDMVLWYDDNTLQIGDVIYNVEHAEGNISLTLAGYTFLIVQIQSNGDLLILNSDNSLDFRKYIKCE